MLVNNILIASGVLYVGMSKYKENKKKKEMPWTFYAERMQKRQLVKRRGRKKRTFLLTNAKQALSSSLTSAKLIWHESTIGPLLRDSRSQQLDEISTSLHESQVDEVEQKLNRDLTISAISLAFASAGPLFYAPLSLLSIPGLLWINLAVAQDAYHSFGRGRGIGVDAVATLFYAGTIVTGSYFAGALGAFFNRFSKILLLKTEDHSIQSLINVFGNQTSFVWLLSDGLEVEVSVDTLTRGDIIVDHA